MANDKISNELIDRLNLVIALFAVASLSIILIGCSSQDNETPKLNSVSSSESDAKSASFAQDTDVPLNQDDVNSEVSHQSSTKEGLGSDYVKKRIDELTDSSNQNADSESSNDDPSFEVSDEQTIDIPETWKRLGKNEIWVDFQNKQVAMGGYICINFGALEMFACPAGTKEHESIVAVNALASEMHAALIAVGGEPGAPCSWDEVSFTPASGSKINIEVRWRDESTNEIITRSAKDMMKTSDEKKPEIDWVFGGSRFYEDLETKTRYYVANSGEMICVSNFSTAAIDLNIVSSETNTDLLFWANTEKIPARGTKVYIILTPGEFLKSEPEIFEPATDPAVPTEQKDAPIKESIEPQNEDNKSVDNDSNRIDDGSF